MLKFPKTDYIEDPDHIAWLHDLPCIVTGYRMQIQAHHLLRGTGEKAGGKRAGDDWALPMFSEAHDFIHWHGGEEKVFRYLGIEDQNAAAQFLYEITGDTMSAKIYIKDRFEKNWRANQEKIKCSSRILRPAAMPLKRLPTNKVNWTKS